MLDPRRACYQRAHVARGRGGKQRTFAPHGGDLSSPLGPCDSPPGATHGHAVGEGARAARARAGAGAALTRGGRSDPAPHECIQQTLQMLRMHLQHWATVPKQRHHTCIETIRRQRERRGLVRGLFTAPGTVSGGCSLTYQHNRDMRCCLYHARTALKSRPDASLGRAGPTQLRHRVR